MPGAVFTPDGRDRYVATELARGPWDPRHQHGGAPAALLAHVFEQLPAVDGLELARITYELMRPVPLGPLAVTASVVRPGKRVQLLEASIHDPEGVEVVRARALQVQRARAVSPVVVAPEPPPPPGPGDPGATVSGPPPGADDGTLFTRDAVEIRFVSGSQQTIGPGQAWFRLRVPIVEGVEISPLQRVAAATDFGNAVGKAVSWEEHVFVNPDLTVYLERLPVGEWIGLDSVMRVGEGGVGLAESVLYDERGRIGRGVQALLIAPR